MIAVVVENIVFLHGVFLFGTAQNFEEVLSAQLGIAQRNLLFWMAKLRCFGFVIADPARVVKFLSCGYIQKL